MRFPDARNILKEYPVYAAALLVILAILAAGALMGPPEKPAPAPARQAKIVPKKNVPPKAAVAAAKPPAPGPSAFELESAMTPKQLMARWDPLIATASKRFNVSEAWIRAVMRMESGGRTMLAEGQPIVSTAGAMGIMQVMPQTYATMKKLYGLGDDPFDPSDNLMAGTATLHLLHKTYGYPLMFAAYNDGPGMLEAHRRAGEPWPLETINYVAGITAILSGGSPSRAGGATVRLTRPDGAAVMIDAAAVMSVRAALPGEYAPGVQTVIAVQRMRQGVREGVAQVRAVIRAHGGRT
jgi:soluble lytic murein transglycosylase-like protein